jgi:citrate/tricarballylate utilization protein
MYTPPHEFSINLPKIMAEVRTESYRRWSWPTFLSECFASPRSGIKLTIFAVAVVFFIAAAFLSPSRIFVRHIAPGSFYQVVSYGVLVSGGVLLSGYGLGVWLLGGIRFWSEVNTTSLRSRGLGAVLLGIADGLSLPYLKGGGPGCFYPNNHPSSARRLFHTLTAWGFGCALISTTLAAIYQDVFHRLPPFPLTSSPVLFGTVGGVALIIGSVGLLCCKWQSDKSPAETRSLSIDYIFLAMLSLTSLSGILLLAFRTAASMGILLIIHLSLVAALFVTAPYGKFVHLVYRFLAIVKYRMEQATVGSPQH